MNLNVYDSPQVTIPIAREFVKIMEDKKISYAQALEVLDIAKEMLAETTLCFLKNA